jgi:phage terminase large subunit-like protein
MENSDFSHDSDKKQQDWVNFRIGHPVQFDPFADADGYFLDVDEGQKAVDFFPSCLCHIKGQKALTPFDLELWQKSIIGHLFGWKSEKTGLRRFREAFVFIPRKNGKTLLGAGLALSFLFTQRERGQEIYCAAVDRDQARLLFDVSKMMILKDSDLKERVEVLRYEIRHGSKDSVFRVISSEAASKHGYSSSFVVLDELHGFPDRELVDVLQTSTGARREPLLVSLTTAGYDQESVCHEKYTYAKNILNSVFHDAAFMPIIFETTEADDWTHIDTWKRCNPNLGKSISIEYLRRECERAKETPAYEAVFKRLHLNMWTQAESPLISLIDWDRGGGPLPDLIGQKCFGGLDLASTQDLTAFSLCFPPDNDDDPFYFMSFAWIPADAVQRQRTRKYYDWVQQGHLLQVPGAVVDYAFVISKIKELAGDYDLQAILFDRWGASAVYQALEGEGMTMIQHGQGYKDMSPPTKEFLNLVLSGRIRHGDHPVLRWCVSNLMVEQDAAANLKPSKKKSSDKIDLCVSSIMSLQGCLVASPKVESKYKTEGLFTFGWRDDDDDF